MRKSAVLLLALVFLTATCLVVASSALPSADVAEDSWVSKAPMQVARGGLGVAAVNGKIYAIGGSTQKGLSTYYADGIVGTNEEYNPATDTWTFKASMPTPIVYFSIAVHQNKIYCMGGYTRNAAVTGVNEVYDPATDTWETKTSMPTPRALLRANVVNGKIYLIGGYAPGFSYSTLNEVYDPATDSWTTKAPLPTATASYASAVVDNKIYVINSNLNQIYDTENDSWSYGTPLIGFFGGMAVATTGVMAPRRIYALGVISYGESGNVSSENNVRVYDPETDSWSFGADMPTKRQEFGVAVVNDMPYAIGGQTYDTSGIPYVSSVTIYATNEQYTPFGYGTVPPTIRVVSPENKTYVSSNVSLAFTVNKPASWVGYSLDSQDNVTITGNTTLVGLANGSHNITVYAKDEFENTGASETVTFTIAKETEAFPIRLAVVTAIVVAALVLVAAVGVGLSAYLKKRK
jgi:N-acetylneuraminic acid mutarotase